MRTPALVSVALLASGCGIVDLWVRSTPDEPVDSGLLVREERCLQGIAAFCACREQTAGRPCVRAENESFLELCIDQVETWGAFFDCTADELDVNYVVDCGQLAFCGDKPE